MINIGLCDDDPAVLHELHQLLAQYQTERQVILASQAFRSAFDLLAEVERGAGFDILFLDVLMPGENGIDAAAEIRSYDSNVKIIFLTSSAEFAVQSYTVGAYFYQLKPILKEDFFRLMDAALSQCRQEDTRSLILRCKSGITRVELKQIEYCEVIHRTLHIHLVNGRMLESIGSLDNLSEELIQFGNFLRPHRSYLVNLDFVQNLSYKAITMSCLIEIPIPRGKYNEIKNAYLEYSFQKKQVII